MSNKSKTIIFILPGFGGGGAEYVMITLANELANSYYVHFVVGVFEGEFKDKLNSNVTVHNLNVKKMSKAIFPLRSIFRKLRPDVIFSTLIYCNIITSLALKISGVDAKLVLREATTPTNVLEMKSWFFNFLYRRVYNNADQLIAVSDGVKKNIVTSIGINNKNIDVISNPIVGEEIFKLADSKAKENYFIKDSIVTVGKVSKAKDILTLVKAFNIVKLKYECQLIIVGKYFEQTELYKEIHEYIIKNELLNDVLFVGFQKNPFVFMKKAKVFVLSSIYEGSPGVLVQGLAINGNVVSTDCESGPREILANGKAGWLVPVKDYKAMADAILEALSNPKDERNNPILSNYFVKNSVENYKKVLFGSS